MGKNQKPSVNQAKIIKFPSRYIVRAPHLPPLGLTKIPDDIPQINLAMFRQQIIADTWVSNNLDYALMDNSDLFKGWLRNFDSVTGIKRSDEWFDAIGVRDKEGCLRVINTFLSSPEGVQYKEIA